MGFRRSCRKVPTLLAALGLLTASVNPVVLSAPLLAALLVPAPAHALSASAVRQVAEQITVRLEGVGSPGSGVLVKREGNRYTVLTAWHVVSGQKPGEELEIITPDGKRHQFDQGSIKRLGEVDLAVLTFSSANTYQLAQIGDVKSVVRGNPVFVAGFPAADTGKLRFEDGTLVANANVGIDQGYQLLYNNETASGMSGGVILNSEGALVGLHGRGALDEAASLQEGRPIKTGTNQGVPIGFYSQFAAGRAALLANSQAITADDFLAQARQLLGQPGREQEAIRLASQSLALTASTDGYLYRAYAKSDLGDKQGAIADYDHVLAINPRDAHAYFNRGKAKLDLGDFQGAIADCNQVLAINPQEVEVYINRGFAKKAKGDILGAIDDYSRVLLINPANVYAYLARGAAKRSLGEIKAAIADYDQALAIDSRLDWAYVSRAKAKTDLGDKHGAIADYSHALAINPVFEIVYIFRGDLKSDLGDYQGAILDYNQALAINPKQPEAYNNRGIVKFLTGDISGAFYDYSAAISLDSAVGNYYANRAEAAYLLGNITQSCSDLKRAKELKYNVNTNDYPSSKDGAWCRVAL